ncbi:30S ribosomal protein S1, chloroplastic [Morella rubra]|uniref:30S ribosomal protein S1, chloroplastic n=1 Tax=Morella rubra TaxID=262757 RepID=A0A6A1VL63_9ROSI|nr:30S ribosomal protein S1, chloroplastic [Morella rubra]
MPIFSTATLGSVPGLSFLTTDASCTPLPFSSVLNHSNFPKHCLKFPARRKAFYAARVSVSGNANTEVSEQSAGTEVLDDTAASPEASRQARISADWKAARAYKDSGFIYEGRIEGSNGGEPHKSIHEIAKGLTGSDISIKVIQADEENKKLILSEKEALWSKFSAQVNVGDIFEARVGSVEYYGAFIHLRFPDGLYHLTGLVHVSEVSWDLVQDVRDILTDGDAVRVKVITVDREKSRITLSIKQLEEDPLLETLDKVIPQEGSTVPDSLSNSSNIEPLPGLETIFEELLQEDGIDDVRISRQGFEKRVVSQDLQLWLSNAPPTNKKFTLLARAGRQASFVVVSPPIPPPRGAPLSLSKYYYLLLVQVQEIHLTTSLDQEGIKKALQRALERVP